MTNKLCTKNEIKKYLSRIYHINSFENLKTMFIKKYPIISNLINIKKKIYDLKLIFYIN